MPPVNNRSRGAKVSSEWLVKRAQCRAAGHQDYLRHRAGNRWVMSRITI
jgi:hypothetical protein